MVLLDLFEAVTEIYTFFSTLTRIENTHFPLTTGIDLTTGEEVAIKFAAKDKHYSLEKEFENYLILGADGNLSIRIP